MFVLRSKLSVGRFILAILAICFLAVLIYLATLQPLVYIFVAFYAVIVLIVINKSEFVLLKENYISYYKYFIWRKVKYKNVNVLFITKHSYIGRFHSGDFYDKITKQVCGYIYLMKDISHYAKTYVKKSTSIDGEWGDIYIDFQYKSNIFSTLINGGFKGEIYITKEMYEVLGSEIKDMLEKAQFDLSKFKVLETNDKYSTLKALCEKYNAKLTRYEYYEKVFGDFVIEIEYKDKLHKVITDKGDIYLDSNLLSDNSYHIAGQDDTFTRLLDLLEEELFVKS